METIGNFLTQPNKDFPLDCETLEMLQNNAALVAALGNIAGDKVILSGCEASANGSRRSAGLVFVKTRIYPEGEVLKWEGGDTTGGMYVKAEDVAVSAMGVDYPKAYTRRRLAPGVGAENYRWEDFKKPKTPAEMEKLISDLENKLTEAERRMQSEPPGVVKMWAGVKVPEGYALCDGAALRVSDYPELYAAIGTAFNNAVNYNGSQNTTQSGFFRLPDLRGRFVAGYSDVDNDYKKYGDAGGAKTVALTADQLPSHDHNVKDYVMIPHGSNECTVGSWTVGGERCEVGRDSVSGNPKRSQTDGGDRGNIQWIKHPTEKSGGGATHENRPPYYVLAYIIKVK